MRSFKIAAGELRLIQILSLVGLMASQARAQSDSSDACQQAWYGETSEQNMACSCNLTHCDTGLKPFRWPQEANTALRLQSSQSGLRFALDQLKLVQAANGSGSSQQQQAGSFDFLVRLNVRRQQIEGFGGAFTDSAAMMIDKLDERLKCKLIDDYFSAHGLDYSLGRVPIGGTDMSTRAYSYDDLPCSKAANATEDFELRCFALQPEDLELKIPLLQRVNRMRQARQLEPLKLTASSWGAPAWMKNNDNLVQGELRGRPDANATHEGRFYAAYARYITRFLVEYAKHNLTFWSVSPQNEPRTPRRVGAKIIRFNSVNFSPRDMRHFLEQHMVPALDELELREGFKPLLFAWEDTSDDFRDYLRQITQSELLNQRLAGFAIHWYAQGLRELPYHSLLSREALGLSEKFALIATEASFLGGPKLGAWWRAERYARDLIETLNCGFIGWVDWNLALNSNGGPTWVRNELDAAVLIAQDGKSYLKQPTYYALGHLSRFVKPGSHLLASSLTPLEGALEADVHALAAEINQSEAPHLRQVAIVASNEASEPRLLKIKIDGCKLQPESFELELRAKSLTSLALSC